jgi:hypothetical protein
MSDRPALILAAAVAALVAGLAAVLLVAELARTVLG